MSKPAKQATEMALPICRPFHGLVQVSLFIPSADALGYMLSPAFAGFQSKRTCLRSSERTMVRNTDEARRLLNQFRAADEFGERLECISAHLLKSPYLNNPLGGGPDVQESLVIRFDGFDCVTYVEMVLALAGSRTADEFSDALREMRYIGGKVAWHSRNHYMLDWIKNNQRRGIVKNITNGPP